MVDKTIEFLKESIRTGQSQLGDTFARFNNDTEIVNWRTKEVIRGTRTFKEIIKEHLEDPTREWKDENEVELSAAKIKTFATKAKTEYGLTSLTIKGQKG